MLTDLKSNYNVDENRVDLNGQSNGSAMAQAIGRNLTYSKNYTAIGVTSFPATSSNFDGEMLPFMTLWGQFDFWPWEPTAPQVAGTLTYWINRNDAARHSDNAGHRGEHAPSNCVVLEGRGRDRCREVRRHLGPRAQHHPRRDAGVVGVVRVLGEERGR